MASDLLSTLKTYLTRVADGEHTPAELATSLNTWVRESTETIKIKVEEEVKKSVSRMGFIKRAEFDALKKEVIALREMLAQSPRVSKSPTKQSKSKVNAKPKVAPKAKLTVSDIKKKPVAAKKATANKPSKKSKD